MSGASRVSPPPHATVLRAVGDPFETENFEERPPASDPAHVAILNRLFYDSTVDLGGLVRIGPRTYICTRQGWRIVPEDGRR